MNVNSVPQRINKINNVVLNNKLDILGLVKTRLKPDIYFIEPKFSGYCIYRHDRTLRGGGAAAAIICRAQMNVDLVSCSNERLFQVRSDIPAEFCLFLVSSVSVDPILVLVVYRPPSSAHFSFLMDFVSEFIGMVSRVVVMGNFNYNLSDTLWVGQQLVETFSELDIQALRFGNTF